ncbi:MAG: DUF5671 domain-containing protein [Candidatus Pacebacteria bacterium]|nr:DUF5671 domain-containing protein [Candidatus Paceibacterota bacterium]
MENHTAKHFVLQLGSLVSLYLSLSFLLVLIFGSINLIFPDATDSIWEVENFSSSVRTGIAMVVVFFPAYIILTRQVNKTRRKDSENSYLGLTKWLVYLSLLIGGAVILGDLVAVMMAFLEGEITQRFILKALALLVIVGVAFSYYLLDVKGYWLTRERKSILFGILVSILVLVAVVCGFRHIDPPTEVRNQKLDSVQINDLQSIQWQIEEYLLLNDAVPDSLGDIYNETNLPAAPENRPSYRYQKTETGFSLCANFASESKSEKFPFDRTLPTPEHKGPVIVNPYNWDHGFGDVCFERIVKL